MELEKQAETIQNIAFSPDLAFIDVGTTEGFRIYSTNPDTPVQNDRLRGNFGFLDDLITCKYRNGQH